MDGHERFDVATFNIRNGLGCDGRQSWPLRRRTTADTIGRLDADAVGLQEVYGWQLRYLLRRLDGYEAHGEGRSRRRRGEACPVLTRRSRLEVTDHWTRWFGPHPDRPGSRLPQASYPRLATWVRARDRATGRAIDVVNTHLDEHRGANRSAAAAQLADWLAPERPTVLLGDLNTTEDDAAVFDPLRRAGFQSVLPPDAPGTTHQFRGGTGGRRIDHVLVSAHWEVLSAAVVSDHAGGPFPSDHWPVRAELRLVGR